MAYGIDRMRQQPQFDPTALMLADGTIVSGPDSASRAQLALTDEVERRRFEDPGYASRTGSIDNRWDAWFGALQAKQRYAEAMGKRANVDLMGEGPGSGSGFGSWGARVDGGNRINLDQPYAANAMAGATAQALAMRAEQERRNPVRPYTGMFSRPDPRVQEMADAAEVDDSVADAARRRQSSTGQVAPPPSRAKRPYVRPNYGGSYTSPR